MLSLFLRYFFVLLALVGGLIAALFWQFAEPPAWSVFLTPVGVDIVDTRIETRPIGNGGTYYYPVIEVAWPDMPEGKVVLRGVQSTFTEKSRANAEAVLVQYQGRKQMLVRVIDHQPYADRTDIFTLIGAIFATLLAIFGLVTGIVLNRVFRSS